MEGQIAASKASTKAKRTRKGGHKEAAAPASTAAAATTTASTSATPAGPSQAKKSRKKKEKSERIDGGGSEDPVGKPKLKVVVRRLPPNVPEQVFWNAVSPWVRRSQPLSVDQNREASSNGFDQSQVNIEHAYFVQGKLKDGSRRGVNGDSAVSAHIFSRAYVRFKEMDDLLSFHRGFDGHLFKDAKGSEYVAIVEFAPFQRSPADLAKRRKADPREGTIEEDSDYKNFLTSLEKKKAEDDGQTQAEKTDAQLMSQLTLAQANNSNNSERAKHTPLLDHLRAQRTARAESSALKNARNYLSRNNNAFAAASSSSTAGNSSTGAELGKGKGKGKGKGQQPLAAKQDASIPTGPKAGRKKEGQGPGKEKGPKKQQQQQQQQQAKPDAGDGGGGGVSNTPAKGPSSAQKGQGKGAKGSKGQAKASGTEGPVAAPKLSILSKQEGPGGIEVSLGHVAEGSAAGMTEKVASSRSRAKSSRGRGRGGGPNPKPVDGGI